jgi:hypothetical protein
VIDTGVPRPTPPATFADLAASRRAWIDGVLRPWCAAARERDLLLAEAEWADIAGKVDPFATLWTWAWGRFPALVHEGLPGVDETHEVVVALRDGSERRGFPDGRLTRRGRLHLVGPDGTGEAVPIDEIAAVERSDA